MWKIEHRPYRLPFRVPVRTAHGPWTLREGGLVRVSRIDADGRRLGKVGWGEAAPIPWFGTETSEEALRALEGLGGEASSREDAFARVDEAAVSVRAALAAAWSEADPFPDADQKAGATDPVKFLPVAGLLPAGRAALEAVGPRLEQGYRTFKWKVGVGDPADERAILDDLLGELPGGAKLRLDANGAWERRVAERWLALAAERPHIEYVEQPCFSPAKEGAGRVRATEDLLRGLAEDFPVRLALDESLVGAGDVERWLAVGWSGVWVVKPALFGDPGPVLARLAKARADVVFGSALETSVGARAGLRLAFAWAAGRPAAERRALGYGVWPLFEESGADVAGCGAFVRREDVERINPEELWNALS